MTSAVNSGAKIEIIYTELPDRWWLALPSDEVNELLKPVRCGDCQYCGCMADSSEEPVALVTWDEGDEPELWHEVCTRRDGEEEARARRADTWTATQMEAYGATFFTAKEGPCIS